ncbi:MAG: ureidoglycolate lyase [Rhizobiaceae bacterium]
MIEITVLKLTRQAFAEFGDVIETDGAENFEINNGSTIRYHDLAKVETLGENASTLVNIFRGDEKIFPLKIELMERHPMGSQAFISLQGRPFLAVVSHDIDGVPGKPQVFLVEGNQGVNYAASTWHHPLLALEADSDFLVIDRGGDGDNLEEHFFEKAFIIRNALPQE